MDMSQQGKRPSWSTWHVSTSPMRHTLKLRHGYRRHGDLAILSMHRVRKVQHQLCALTSVVVVEEALRSDAVRRRMLKGNGMKRSCDASWNWRNATRKMDGIVMSWEMRRDS